MPVVAKAGLRYVKLPESSEMMPGYFAGIDVRMGVGDNSYILGGAALGRQHTVYRSTFANDASTFNVKEGLEYARFNAGIEGRVRPRYERFNVRWHAKMAMQFTLNEVGDLSQDISSNMFMVPMGIGIDFSFICADFTIEPAITEWVIDSDVKPIFYAFSVGFQF